MWMAEMKQAAPGYMAVRRRQLCVEWASHGWRAPWPPRVLSATVGWHSFAAT